MPNRGEVWMVDLGLAQKARPALILNRAFKDTDRALISVIPHTLTFTRFRIRGERECAVPEARSLSGPKPGYGGSGQSRAIPGPADAAAIGAGRSGSTQLAWPVKPGW